MADDAQAELAASEDRVRALAGDLVARPLDEPAAAKLAEMLSGLGDEDSAALRRLAAQRRANQEQKQ